MSLVLTWRRDPTFTYGFLILPIALCLAWRRRSDLLLVCPQPSYWGVLGFLAAILLWLAGNVTDVRELQQFALIAAIDSLILSAVGPRAARKLLFALGFLFFSVPVGRSLIAPLQEFTANFVALALRLSGVPVVLEGHVLSVPNARWEVAEACSGIRYLTVTIMVGVLLAGITYRSWRRRIALLAIATVVPIIANGIRAYGIILLGFTTNNPLAVSTDHLMYGTVFFFVVTLCLLVIADRWREAPLSVPDKNPSPVPELPIKSRFAALLPTLLCLGIALVASFTAAFAWSRTAKAQTQGIRVESSGWMGLSSTDQDWAPAISTTDQSSSQIFVSGRHQVFVYIGQYQYGPGKFQLVESYNALSPNSSWRLETSGTEHVSIARQSFEVKENAIRRGSETRLVWIWYSIGGDFTANPYKAKLFSAWNRLSQSGDHSALIAISAPYAYEQSQARNALHDFLEQTSFSSAP